MPPKRAKKAPPALPALDGCKIVFSGSFPGGSQRVFKVKAESLGATVAATIGSETTHLIASYADVDKKSPKVAKAQSLGIHIVSMNWLMHTEEKNVKQPEKDFAIGPTDEEEEDDANQSPYIIARPPSAAPIPVIASATNGITTTGRSLRKRGPSPTRDDVKTGSVPNSKRSRGTKAVKAEDDGKDSMGKENAEPVVGAGQVAKNKDIQIPVDENCPFATSKVYIDPSGVIWDASLNQTNASANNNKFYRIQVCSSTMHLLFNMDIH